MPRILQLALLVATALVAYLVVRPQWRPLGALAAPLTLAFVLGCVALVLLLQRALGAPAPTAPPVSGERLHWADIAKAIAVVLVVAYHVSPTTIGHLLEGTNRAAGLYSTFTTWLLPVRMPLFFMISGMLAVRALHRPWRAVVRPRVADIMWPFLLWTALLAVPFAVAYVPADPVSYLPRQAGWLINLSGNYWYLPLLVAFFLTAKLLRAAPLYAIGLGVVIYFWSNPMPRTIGEPFDNDLMLTIIRFCQFWLWFALGAFARPLVERWARLPAWVGAAAFVAYWPLVWLRYEHRMNDLTIVTTVVGITAILTFSRLLAGWEPAARLGTYLAARTLPIYLYHPLLLALIVLALPKFEGVGSAATIPLVPLLVVGVTAIACLAYDATRRRLPWLYAAPGRREVPSRREAP